MAQVNQYGTKVEVTVSLVLPEDEARALKWVVDYGAENMAKFAEGGAEARRHKDALTKMVSNLRSGLAMVLDRADKARAAFEIHN